MNEKLRYFTLKSMSKSSKVQNICLFFKINLYVRTQGVIRIVECGKKTVILKQIFYAIF